MQKIRDQLSNYIKNIGIEEKSCGSDVEKVKRCFVSGFFLNVAILQPDLSYKNLVDHKVVYVHPSSCLFQKKIHCVLYNESVLTKKHYLRNVMSIQYEWLPELVPSYYEKIKQN